MVRKSTSADPRSSISCRTSFRSSPKPDHDAGLGEHLRIEFLDPLQQPDRVEIARAGPDGQVVRRHGFEIVVEDVRFGRDHHFQRAGLAQEVRGQDFDGRFRRAGADGRDDLGEMLRPAVLEIVAVDRGDDDVLEARVLRPHRRRCSGSSGSSGSRQAGADIAEGAGAGADLAHDHHGGVPLLPAFPDIGAAGLLAHRDQPVFADDPCVSL